MRYTNAYTWARVPPGSRIGRAFPEMGELQATFQTEMLLGGTAFVIAATYPLIDRLRCRIIGDETAQPPYVRLLFTVLIATLLGFLALAHLTGPWLAAAAIALLACVIAVQMLGPRPLASREFVQWFALGAALFCALWAVAAVLGAIGLDILGSHSLPRR